MPIVEEVSGITEALKLQANAKDYTGQKFGHLEVLRPYDRSADKHIRWLCRCKCGKLTAIVSNGLKQAKSCGCVTRWEGHKKVWPKPVKPNAPQDLSSYAPSIVASRNALQLGDAGEHIVCADLLCAGWNAYQSAQGLPYDVVVDVEGRLLRIAVKSTSAPKTRPNRKDHDRQSSRAVYCFSINRTIGNGSGGKTLKRYTTNDADIVAMVALDTRKVAYSSISECKSRVEIFAPHGSAGFNHRGPKSGGKKKFELLTFQSALEAFYGVRHV